MIVIAGTLVIDPAKRDEAIAAAKQMMKDTHAEPGNIAYAFSLDLEDESVIHLFEQWESQAALDLHFASPHMAAFRQKIAGFGVREMNVQRFEIASVGPLG